MRKLPRTPAVRRRGPFDLAQEPIEEPPRRVAAEARRLGLDPDRIWILKHGETRRW